MEDSLYKEAQLRSKPPEEAFAFVPGNDLVLSYGGKQPLRNIFSNQEYLAFEVEKLKRLKEEIKKSSTKLPSTWDDAFLLRIIHGSGYKTRKAFKDLKKSIDAYKLLVPTDIRVLYPKVSEVLKTGFLYIHGRDKFFRPAVVLDCTRVDIKRFSIESYIDATVFLMQFVIENMLVPGKVESWVNLVEMNHQGLTELPLKSLMKLSAVLQDVYKCRLAHSFIINPPSSIYFIWKCFSPFIDKVTQSKIIIVKEGISAQMMDLIETSQLEKRFGGTSDNLQQFWPPVFPKSFSQPVAERKKEKKKTVVRSQEESEIEAQKDDSVLSEAKSRHSKQDEFFRESQQEEENDKDFAAVEEEQFEAARKELNVFAEPQGNQENLDYKENTDLRENSDNQEYLELKRMKKKERRKKRKDRKAQKIFEDVNKEEKITDVKASEDIIDYIPNKEISEIDVIPEVHDKIPLCGCDMNRCDIF